MRKHRIRSRRESLRPFRPTLEHLETRLPLVAEIEPNDAPMTATVFTENALLEGQLSKLGDIDYFRIALAQGTRLRVHGLNEQAWNGRVLLPPKVEVVDGLGRRITGSSNGFDVQFIAPVSDTYFVRITSDTAFGDYADQYVIRTTVTLFSGTNEQSPNDGIDSATPVEANRMFRGELGDNDLRDYFSFTLNASQTFYVQFAGNIQDRPGARLYSASGAMIAESLDGRGLAVPIVTTGRYALEVIDNASAGTTTGYVGSGQVGGTSDVLPDFGNTLEENALWPSLVGNGLYATREGFLRAELTDLNDVDTYRVQGSLHQNVFSLRPGHADDFSAQDREIKLLDRFGNLVAATRNGDLSLGDIVRNLDEYFIQVRALGPTGLGVYGLRRSESSDFSIQRDIPLHFVDFAKQNPQYLGFNFTAPYGVPDAIPLILGMHQARFDFVDVDYTLIKPPADVAPYIGSGVGDFENLNGGVGGGYHDYRRPSGGSANNLDDTSWTSFQYWPSSLLNHEFGHAAGLPHVRDPSSNMAYVHTADVFQPGDTLPFMYGDQRRPDYFSVNTRETLDYNLSAGSQVAEQSSPLSPIQDLSLNLLEMSLETLTGPSVDLPASPNQVLRGDFNGDGWDDLVVGFAGSSIAVLLNDRTGKFLSPVTTNVDPIAWWNEGITVGDFNRDGRDDVATISRERETMTLLFADANGVLVADAPESIGRWPQVIQAVDMTNDGILDLVSANANNQVTIRRGRGDGTFEPALSRSMGSDPNHLVLKDFNGDFLVDIAIANYANDSLTIYLATATGEYFLSDTIPAGSVSRGLAGADMDHDSDVDLVFANHHARTMTWYRNRGNGTFALGGTYPLFEYTENLLIEDINRDGHLDVVASGANWNIDVLLGNGNGEFTRSISLPAAGGAVFTASIDVDRDGILDLATVGAWQNRLSMRRIVENTPRNDRVIVHGRIDDASDIDDYRIELQAGVRYFIDIESAEYQETLDASLDLYDAFGNLLAWSDRDVDLDSGIDSVDPFLVWTPSSTSFVRIEVSGERSSVGTYRLKITPSTALTQEGPRIVAAIPDNGASINSARQILLATDAILDARTLTSQSVVVTGALTGVRSGSVLYDPTESFLIWTADAPLPQDRYTVTLRSGPDGVRDLKGRWLDGEIPTNFRFPRISGDGLPGGDFSTEFTVDSPDTSPAIVNYASYELDPSNRGRFQLNFSDGISIASVESANFMMQGAGPDGTFNTVDDRWAKMDAIYDKPYALVSNGVIFLYSRGVPDPDRYLIHASLKDDAGNMIQVAEEIVVGVTIPEGALFTDATKSQSGLIGSYVNSSLRSVTSTADWRTTQAISGTRNDRIIGFYTDSFGLRSEVGVTGGSDVNWENFSAQWDGVISIPRDGIRLQTRSDDGSRLWVDINKNGSFESNELFNNGWGTGQGVVDGALTPPLTAGDYAIRVQYEEGFGGNRMALEWITPDVSGDIREDSHGPTIVSQSLKHGEIVVGEGLRTIEIGFSGALDIATLTPANFRLRFSQDPVFYDGDDVFLPDADGAIAWDPRQRLASFETSTNFLPGYYLIELNGELGGIKSTNGRLLDGEFFNSVILGNTNLSSHAISPSGDGLAGGTYRSYFSVGPSAVLASVDVPSISERGGETIGTVRRINSDTRDPLVVSWVVSHPSKLAMPSTVTIPAGQTSASFIIRAIDNNLLDGDVAVVLQPSVAGYQSETAVLVVTDYEALSLASSAASVSEMGGAATLTLTRPNPQGVLVVQVTNTQPDRSGVPLQVTFPAGVSSVTVPFTAIDNDLVDGSEVASVYVGAPGYISASVDVLILDHEVLAISLDRSTISERGGRASGKVRRTDPRGNLVVLIQSTPDGELLAPATISIPDGALESSSFELQAVDDTWVEPTESIAVVALANGYIEGSTALQITDYEELQIQIDSVSISERDGQALARIRRGDSRTELRVALAPSNANPLVLPNEIVIPVGSLTSSDFWIQAVDNSLVDGTRASMISASAPGYVPSSVSLQITDYEPITVTLDVGSISELNGQTTATVTRTDPRGELWVNLSVSDSSEASVQPSAVMIRDGEWNSDPIQVFGVDDALLDGTQTISLLASAIGYVNGSALLQVQDYETLSIAFAASQISERAGSTMATVTRNNTNLSAPLTLTMASSDPTELATPGSITIPAGQASVSFRIDAVDDQILDGTQSPRLRVSATGYQPAEEILSVTDFETLIWGVQATTISENQGQTIGTLTRSNTDMDTPVVVTLVSLDPTEVSVPGSVIIPAGAMSVSFSIQGVDDTLFDGQQLATLSATASGYEVSTQLMRVDDYESLDIVLDSDSISEFQGRTMATVRRNNTDVGTALVVNLSASDATEIRVNATATIPAGSQEVRVELTARDDLLLDGTQPVQIGVSANGYVGDTVQIQVLDYETLRVTLNQFGISERSGTALGTIARSNTDWSNPLLVQLNVIPAGQVTIPSTVTIPAGQASTTFNIVAVDDSLLDGTQQIGITASASGYVAGSESLFVYDYETLSVIWDSESVEESAGTATLRVQRNNSDLGQELVVRLSSSDTSELIVPSEVRIPAGESYAILSAQVIDDQLLDGDIYAQVSASSDGYIMGASGILVKDHEELLWSLSAAEMSERDGAITVTLSRPANHPQQSLAVSLVADPPGAVTLPANVLFSVGADRVTFSVTAVRDLMWTGDRVVTLKALASGYADSARTVSVIDVLAWVNVRNPFDVDDDRTVSPLDVLALVNELNRAGSRALPVVPTQGEVPPPYLDPDDDGSISPLDVLVVINYINSRMGSGGEGEGNAKSVVSPESRSVDAWMASFAEDDDYLRRDRRMRHRGFSGR